jgi:hypothetical protein
MSAYSAAVLADTPLDYWRFADASLGRCVSVGSRLIDLAPQDVRRAVFGYSGPVSDGGSILTNLSPLMTGNYTSPATWTMEQWLWVGFEGQAEEIIVSVPVAAGQAAIYLDAGAPLNLHFGIFGGVYSGAFNITQQRWHQTALRYDGANLQLVIDGAQVGSTATAVAGNTASIKIGGQGPALSDLWLSEAAFYNGALSNARLNAHFAAADQVADRPEPLDPLQADLAAILAAVRRTF